MQRLNSYSRRDHPYRRDLPSVAHPLQFISLITDNKREVDVEIANVLTAVGCKQKGYLLLIAAILTSIGIAETKSTVLKKLDGVDSNEPILMNLTKTLLTDAKVSDEVLTRLDEVLNNPSEESEMYIRYLVADGIKKGHISVSAKQLDSRLEATMKDIEGNRSVNIDSRSRAIFVLKALQASIKAKPMENSEALAVYGFGEKVKITRQGGALETATASLAELLFRGRAKPTDSRVTQMVWPLAAGGDFGRAQDFYITDKEFQQAKTDLHKNPPKEVRPTIAVAQKELLESQDVDMKLSGQFLKLLSIDDRRAILEKYIKQTSPGSLHYIPSSETDVESSNGMIAVSDEQVKTLVIQKLITEHLRKKGTSTYTKNSNSDKQMRELLLTELRSKLSRHDLPETAGEMAMIQGGIAAALDYRGLSQEEMLAALYTISTVESLKSGMTAQTTLSSFLGHLLEGRPQVVVSPDVRRMVAEAGDAAGFKTGSKPWYQGDYSLLDSKLVEWHPPCFKPLGTVGKLK